MRRRHVAAGMMAAVVAATTVLGGCSGKKADTGSTAAGEKQTAGTEQAAGTEAAGDADKSSWISEEPVEITVMMKDNPSQPLKVDAPMREEIFKKTNIKLNVQIVPNSSYEEKKNIVLGTNNFPDIIFIPNMADVVTYGNSGVFEPLTQYLNEEDMPNLYKFWQEYPEMKKYLLGDELYVFPVVAREETANGFGPVIRQDLLEANNLETPKTFDELLDVLIKFKELYPDSIPWTGRKGTPNLFKTTSYMLGSGYGDNGLYYDFDEEKFVFGPASTNFKAVLDYLNRAYEAGVLDPEFATTTAEQMESKLSSGKSLFYLDNSGFGQNYTKMLRKVEGQENATFQVLPIPENSFGQRRATAYATELPGRFYALNAGSKHKEEIIKLMDWLYSKEGSDITNYGVEGVSFEYDEKGEPQFKEDYVMKFKDAQPSDYYAIYTDLGITKLDFCMWACNTKTWFEIQQMDGNWDEVADEYWKIIEEDDAYVQPHIFPTLSEEESEKVKDILVDVNTMLEQEYNKYIMGQEEIDNWDNVIKRCEDMGIRELEDIYNQAEARVNAQ
ncbi:MAG: extracellular solute-binding protein [Lachnospiraceae bacterium]|nr:extracellular solute-binding protein [Lachnospiraceae bacterium]